MPWFRRPLLEGILRPLRAFIAHQATKSRADRSR
jgi:hypothetical protein